MAQAAQLLRTYLGKSGGKHGEGSRGGHIIGHTRRGKAIYAVHDSAGRRALVAIPETSFGYNSPADYHQAKQAADQRHFDGVAAAGAHFPDWSIDDHKEAGRALRAHARSLAYGKTEAPRDEMQALYHVAGGHDVLAQEFARHGHEIEGPHGPQIGTTVHGMAIHADPSIDAASVLPLHDEDEVGVEHIHPNELHEGEFDDTLGSKMRLANGHTLNFHTKLESAPYFHAATREDPEESGDAEYGTDVYVTDKKGQKVSGLHFTPQMQDLIDRHAEGLNSHHSENYEAPEREYDKYEHDDI